MYLTYTFYSQELHAETMITWICQDFRKLPLRDERLPVLVLLGDKGLESSWWLRSVCPENILDKKSRPCALAAVRNEDNAGMLDFLRDELPYVLCSQFPVDGGALGLLGYGEGARLALQAADANAAYCSVTTLQKEE